MTIKHNMATELKVKRMDIKIRLGFTLCEVTFEVVLSLDDFM